MPVSVCHLTCAHEPFDVRIFEKECVSLADAGYRVTLVAPNANNQTVRGVEVVGVRAKSLNPLARVFWLARRVYKRALAVDADVYHFHDIELFRYGLKLKRRGKKVIFDSHENWFGYAKSIGWLPTFVKSYLEKYLKSMYSKGLPLFDRVITVSPHIVEILSEYAGGNVELIANYPLIDADNRGRFSFDEYSNRANIACYAGTVYKFSLQENIIRALAEITNIKYRIIGNISEEYKAKLLPLDRGEVVEFVNFVAKKELNAYYNSSTMGFAVFDYIPNLGGKKGSLGINKIYEYMAQGLPIISTDFELWEAIFSKYKCGICVNPYDISAIRNAVLYLQNNKQEAYNMGQNGQRAVEEEFNWRTQERVLLQTYKNVAGT